MTGYDRTSAHPPSPAARAAFRAAFGVQADVATVRRDGFTYDFSPIALIGLGGARVALLSGGRLRDAYHPSPGVNAVHYLERRAGGYRVRGRWLDVGMDSEEGEPAWRWATARVPGLGPILYTEGRSTFRGCDSSLATITLLAPARPRDVATFPGFYSDDGMKQDKAKVTVLQGTVEALDPHRLVISYAGSQSFTATYARHGRGYRLVGWDRVPGC